MNISSQDGSQECGDQTAGVDSEVEEGEEIAQVSLLLGQFELVSTKGGDARFNASCSEGYQQESHDCEFPGRNKDDIRPRIFR